MGSIVPVDRDGFEVGVRVTDISRVWLFIARGDDPDQYVCAPLTADEAEQVGKLLIERARIARDYQDPPLNKGGRS